MKTVLKTLIVAIAWLSIFLWIFANLVMLIAPIFLAVHYSAFYILLEFIAVPLSIIFIFIPCKLYKEAQSK